jgi:hypothetical protein
MKRLKDGEIILLNKFIKYSPVHRVLIAVWWSWFNMPKFEKLIEELETGKTAKAAFYNASCSEIPNNSGN